VYTLGQSEFFRLFMMLALSSFSAVLSHTALRGDNPVWQSLKAVVGFSYHCLLGTPRVDSGCHIRRKLTAPPSLHGSRTRARTIRRLGASPSMSLGRESPKLLRPSYCEDNGWPTLSIQFTSAGKNVLSRVLIVGDEVRQEFRRVALQHLADAGAEFMQEVSSGIAANG
jgi:hypothetical protein